MIKKWDLEIRLKGANQESQIKKIKQEIKDVLKEIKQAEKVKKK